jgi:hypothetical protein
MVAAMVEHLLASAGSRRRRGDLRAQVLDLEPALVEFRDRLDRRGLVGRTRRGNPQAGGHQPGRRGAQRGQGGGGLVTVGLQPVDPQVDRRAPGQGLALGRAIVAEHPGQVRIEPLRIVAGDPGRSGVKRQRRA